MPDSAFNKFRKGALIGKQHLVILNKNHKILPLYKDKGLSKYDIAFSPNTKFSEKIKITKA